jgi:hypothetical protein
MRWNTFVRSALFAALAAAAYLPALALMGPLLGHRTAVGLYLVGLTTCYLAGLAPRSARRVGVALLVGTLGLSLVAGGASLETVVLGLAAMLAAARSGLLYRLPPGRALVTEAVLTGGGLCFACFLLGPPALGAMLAIWGFFLVQGLFFLIARRELRATPRAQQDPFESAYACAAELLTE